MNASDLNKFAGECKLKKKKRKEKNSYNHESNSESTSVDPETKMEELKQSIRKAEVIIKLSSFKKNFFFYDIRE